MLDGGVPIFDYSGSLGAAQFDLEVEMGASLQMLFGRCFLCILDSFPRCSCGEWGSTPSF